MVNESAFSVQVTIFFSRDVIMSMTIVPRVCGILIITFFGVFLPPAFLESLFGTFVWPMSWGGSPTVGACEVQAVSFNVECIAFLAEGGGEVARISRSGFQCFWNSNWLRIRDIFFWLRTPASVSVVIISSHGPEYMIILKGVLAGLAEFSFIASLLGWYGF